MPGRGSGPALRFSRFIEQVRKTALASALSAMCASALFSQLLAGSPPEKAGSEPVLDSRAPAPVPAAEPKDAPAEERQRASKAGSADTDTGEAICLMVESAARSHQLPLEFFARVIWQESRFRSDAVGPLTRSGQRAQGIAQFMPGTANERRLLDPFDPVQALPKSAEFLDELRRQFGNLGLAAAAYNAGPKRVQDWLDGTGTMPAETRNYVRAITGSAIEEWAAAQRGGTQDGANDRSPETPDRMPNTSCRSLMALLKQAPNPFVTQLETRVKLGADRPWGVQLAAGFDRNRALSIYAHLMDRLGAVIGDHDPTILGRIWRSRGTRTFYQVRIGTDTRNAADDLCGRIRRAGAACLVLRNGRG